MTRQAPRRERAQALLEFAIVLPLFLILLFATIDFARLLFTYISLSNGAREMARVAAVSTNWSGTSAINAFLNYVIVAAPQNSATDSVTIVTGNSTCARTMDSGGSCPTSGVNAPQSVTCTLPLSGSCTLNQPPQGGFVQVQVNYTFQFNPLFQTRLDGIVDVSFMRPTALVTTSSRAYVE